MPYRGINTPSKRYTATFTAPPITSEAIYRAIVMFSQSSQIWFNSASLVNSWYEDDLQIDCYVKLNEVFGLMMEILKV